VTGRGIALKLAEVAGEGDLLIVGDVLFTKDEDSVSVHPGLDRRHLRGAKRAAAVDAGNLTGKYRMQRADRNRHGGSPPGDRFLSSYQVSDIAFRLLTINTRKKNLIV
jgi:hypothetical protein